jgi:hypothetical protein
MPVAAAVAGRPRVPPQRVSRRSVIASERQIRDGGAFDAVIDFDAAVRDSANPSRMLPACDSDDHLHPNDAGYEVMGELIDVGLFRQLRRWRSARGMSTMPLPHFRYG